LRQAMITFLACRRTRCFAASNPKPVFAPVTIYVPPEQVLVVARMGRSRRCSRTNSLNGTAMIYLLQKLVGNV
jgi:hypothetical protein